MWAETEAEARAFIEDAISKIENAAREEIQQHVAGHNGKPAAGIAATPTAIMTAEWQLHYAEKVREALESSAAIWPAYYGFSLGLEVNRWPLDKRDRKIRILAPDAEWSRGLRRRLRTSKPRGPSAEVICEHVRKLHSKWPLLNWSTVCKRVGEAHGISRQTVSKRAQAADWRNPPRK
jgi:hypothetical protein